MGRFFSELRRRNVLRVGVAYLTIAWLCIEVSNTILPLFDVGPSVSRLVVILFAIGFLPVLLFTWTFEFTPAGIRFERDVDRTDATIVEGAKRLDRLIIVLLGIALAYFAIDKFVLLPQRELALVDAAREDAARQAVETARATDAGRSIAVLPFENASGDETNDYLSEGLSDELRESLAEVPGMLVVARSSSVRFSAQGYDARSAAEQLGVGWIVEGRFNRAGNRIVVSVQLIDAATGFQLWAQRYDRSSRDLLQLQRELVHAVSSQLVTAIRPQNVATQPSAKQVSAHDLLLLGRQYEQQVTDRQLVDEDKLQKAIDYYRQAIAVDPSSAEANARLGKMLLYLGDVDAAAEPIFTALRLNPQQSDANATLGLYYWLTRQEGIGAAYRRAIELNPNNADALSYYADWLWMQAEPLEAEIYFTRARDVDPLSLERQSKLGYKFAFAGKREEAEQIVQRILELFPTDAGFLAAARIAEAYGAPEQAIALALKALALRPDDRDIAGQLAESFARIGDFDSAEVFDPEPGVGQLFWYRRYDELIALGQELMIEFPEDEDLLLLQAFALGVEARYDEAMRIYDRIGMPLVMLSESRRPNELHHAMSFVGVLQGAGQGQRAAELAGWLSEFNETMSAGDNGSWAIPLSIACFKSVLGDREGALQMLETLPRLRTIVWMPFLKDLRCMQELADQSRYLAVVSAMEKRLAGIRASLPGALQGYGLTPVAPGQK